MALSPWDYFTWSVIIASNLSVSILHSKWICTQRVKDLRVLQLICLYMVSIKDTTQESAVKGSSEIQNTMAKSTNGQYNDRGSERCPEKHSWVCSQKAVAMADSKTREWNYSFCPVSERLHLPRGQSVERRRKSAKVLLAWLLNGDKGEEEMDGVHGRGVLSALHWQHKRTCYSECKGMFVVNAPSDKCKPILRPGSHGELKRRPRVEILWRRKSCPPQELRMNRNVLN